MRDSGETTDQSETAAQFLEDLAAHAQNRHKKSSSVLLQQVISEASSPKHSRKPQAAEGESRTKPT